MNFDFDVFCERKKSYSTLFWTLKWSKYQHKTVDDAAAAAGEAAAHDGIDYKRCLAAGNC